jgi:hypothetical protein
MTEPAPPRAAPRTAVALFPLTFVDEGDQVIIGRPDIDSFAVFPADAAAVVRRLRMGEDLTAVAAWYQETYGEPADIDDFVDTLCDLDFVRPEAGPEDPADIPVLPPVRWHRLGTAVFSAPALVLYALAVGTAVYLMVRIPALQPVPSKIFFTRSLLVVMGVTCVGQLFGVSWHEGFHALAGRRLGLPSRLSVGRRLYFLVFQTTLVGLMGVPSRKRILPYCAGLIADALFISLLTGLAEASHLAGWPSWVARVAVALVYVTAVRMLWQAMIFMETDLYYVLASALRCSDLHRMTRAYLRSRVARWFGRPQPAVIEAGWTASDLRIVRWYAPFVIAGSATLIGLAAVSVLPVLAGFIVRTYRGVLTGSYTSLWFWDSLVAGLAILSQFVVVAAIALRDRRRRLAAPASS